MPYYLLLPFASAIIFSLGSIVIKRALKEGVTMDQSFHLTNLVLGAMFLPLLFLEKSVVEWSEFWKPVLMGVAFFVGNWLAFFGLKRGDVSLVTPIMGTKVVFVAVGVVLLTGKVPSVPLWIAAFMTAAGIFVMGIADLKKGRHLHFTVGITLGSAAVFGLSDVLVSWWAADFGALTFITLGFLSVSVFTSVMWLLQKRPSLRLKAGQRSWASWGSVLIGLQALAMSIALSFFDDATGINVVYASRGVWAIVLVVALGVSLGNREHKDSGKAFWWRIIGTFILTVAIVIAVVDRSNHPIV
ncbi:EamA family transporter [Verrucomicrobiales bacterium BCK34]|nr:EamA family transporter [Verrucomicrobiales bacterium BCK34]